MALPGHVVLPTIRAPFRRLLGFDVRTGVLLLVVFGLATRLAMTYAIFCGVLV